MSTSQSEFRDSHYYAHLSFADAAAKDLACPVREAVRQKAFNKDGRLIKLDYVLPKANGAW